MSDSSNLTGRSISGQLQAEADTTVLAAALGRAIAKAGQNHPLLLYLHGDLGAGKTFFARELLRSQQVNTAVKSPTYTLIEPYECALGRVLHLDLYRLSDPEEMVYLGLEEQLAEARLVMIEWPQQARGFLPPADLQLNLVVQADGRSWQLQALSKAGEAVLVSLSDKR